MRSKTRYKLQQYYFMDVRENSFRQLDDCTASAISYTRHSGTNMDQLEYTL